MGLRAFVCRCRIVSESFATFLSSAPEGALACLYLISYAPLSTTIWHPCVPFDGLVPRDSRSPQIGSLTPRILSPPRLGPMVASQIFPPSHATDDSLARLPRTRLVVLSGWDEVDSETLGLGEGRCDGTTMTKRNETSSHTTRPQLVLRQWRKAARPRPPKCGGGAHWLWLERHVR